MLFGNNQIKFTLTPDRNGVVKQVSGHELISSLEVHKDITLTENTGYSFTLPVDSTNTSLLTSSLPTTPIYIDGSSEASGQLDGGLIVAGGAAIGTSSLGINIIGGSNANVIPVLTTGYNEVLSTNNDIVYAILSTDQSDGDTPLDNRVQVTFATVDDTGDYSLFNLGAGVYYIEPNTIYSFGHARLSNLAANGRNSSMAGASSLDELKDLISSNAPLTWINPTLLNDWVNYGNGFMPVRYAVKDDFIFIDGTVKDGLINTPIFNLPINDRPPFTVVLPVVSGIGTGRLQVHANGDVVLVDGDASFTTLHSTIFK